MDPNSTSFTKKRILMGQKLAKSASHSTPLTGSEGFRSLLLKVMNQQAAMQQASAKKQSGPKVPATPASSAKQRNDRHHSPQRSVQRSDKPERWAFSSSKRDNSADYHVKHLQDDRKAVEMPGNNKDVFEADEEKCLGSLSLSAASGPFFQDFGLRRKLGASVSKETGLHLSIEDKEGGNPMRDGCAEDLTQGRKHVLTGETRRGADHLNTNELQELLPDSCPDLVENSYVEPKHEDGNDDFLLHKRRCHVPDRVKLAVDLQKLRNTFAETKPSTHQCWKDVHGDGGVWDLSKSGHVGLSTGGYPDLNELGPFQRSNNVYLEERKRTNTVRGSRIKHNTSSPNLPKTTPQFPLLPKDNIFRKSYTRLRADSAPNIGEKQTHLSRKVTWQDNHERRRSLSRSHIFRRPDSATRHRAPSSSREAGRSGSANQPLQLTKNVSDGPNNITCCSKVGSSPFLHREKPKQESGGNNQKLKGQYDFPFSQPVQQRERQEQHKKQTHLRPLYEKTRHLFRDTRSHSKIKIRSPTLCPSLSHTCFASRSSSHSPNHDLALRLNLNLVHGSNNNPLYRSKNSANYKNKDRPTNSPTLNSPYSSGQGSVLTVSHRSPSASSPKHLSNPGSVAVSKLVSRKPSRILESNGPSPSLHSPAFKRKAKAQNIGKSAQLTKQPLRKITTRVNERIPMSLAKYDADSRPHGDATQDSLNNSPPSSPNNRKHLVEKQPKKKNSRCIKVKPQSKCMEISPPVLDKFNVGSNRTDVFRLRNSDGRDSLQDMNQTPKPNFTEPTLKNNITGSIAYEKRKPSPIHDKNGPIHDKKGEGKLVTLHQIGSIRDRTMMMKQRKTENSIHWPKQRSQPKPPVLVTQQRGQKRKDPRGTSFFKPINHAVRLTHKANERQPSTPSAATSSSTPHKRSESIICGWQHEEGLETFSLLDKIPAVQSPTQEQHTYPCNFSAFCPSPTSEFSKDNVTHRDTSEKSIQCFSSLETEHMSLSPSPVVNDDLKPVRYEAPDSSSKRLTFDGEDDRCSRVYVQGATRLRKFRHIDEPLNEKTGNLVAPCKAISLTNACCRSSGETHETKRKMTEYKIRRSSEQCIERIPLEELPIQVYPKNNIEDSPISEVGYLTHEQQEMIVCQLFKSANLMARRLIKLRNTVDALKAHKRRKSNLLTNFYQNVLECSKRNETSSNSTVCDYLMLVAFMALQLSAQYLFVQK